MSGSTAIVALRAVLLVALLGYFAGALGFSLVREQRAQGLMLTPGTNVDPGVRVLLMDRPGANQAPTPAHDKLVVDVLCSALVVSPDEPDNPERSFAVGAGDQLVFRPDADGIMLTSNSGHDDRWLVTQVRLIPKAMSREPAANAGKDPESPAKLSPTTFEALDGRPVFMLAGRRYRGSLDVYWKAPKELDAINTLPMEAYVEGVIAKEMGASWPLEALRAQAIVSRSYAYATRMRVRGKLAYDVNDTVDFQDYWGHGFGNDLVENAVKSTAGVVLCVQGQPFAPLFHASSGGWTESISAVQPNASALYGASLAGVMPAQEDPWCLPGVQALGKLSSHWQSKIVLKPSVIRQQLNAWLRAHGDNRTIGYVSDLRVGARDAITKRVQTVMVSHISGSGHTSDQPLEIPAHLFRLIVGPADIHSTLWSDDSPKRIDNPQERGKNYEISSFGYGHGVGMSQVSAWAMASDGRSSTEIINFFYPGAELRTW